MAGNSKFKLGRGKLLAGLLAAVLIVGALGYFGLGAANLPLVSRFTGPNEEVKGREAEAKGAKNGGEYRQLALEPLVVNLADPGSRRYLRVTITLEFTDARVEKEMQRVGYRVRDSIIQILRSKTVADLAPDRAEKVRQELLGTINGLLEEGKITGLYFQEFIIQ